MRPLFRRVSVIFLALAGLYGGAALAQAEVETPYWASLKSDKANARVGPATDFQIAWVYQRKNLPVKVVKRYGPWRKIEDPDGTQSWMYTTLLTRVRTAIVIDDIQEMRAGPSAQTKLLWRAEPGVVGKLGECENGYCEFDVTGRVGYVKIEGLWGAGEP